MFVLENSYEFFREVFRQKHLRTKRETKVLEFVLLLSFCMGFEIPFFHSEIFVWNFLSKDPQK